MVALAISFHSRVSRQSSVIIPSFPPFSSRLSRRSIFARQKMPYRKMPNCLSSFILFSILNFHGTAFFNKNKNHEPLFRRKQSAIPPLITLITHQTAYNLLLSMQPPISNPMSFRCRLPDGRHNVVNIMTQQGADIFIGGRNSGFEGFSSNLEEFKRHLQR
jgi:hypothetical protein